LRCSWWERESWLFLWPFFHPMILVSGL
jgi:hypothetical protein